MKLAAMMQGIVTLPKRVWLIGSGLALSCGAAVAMIGGASAPAPPPAVPATPAPAQATQTTPETPAAPAPAAASGPRQFLPQAPGENVVLDFSSQGCFGGTGPQRFEIRAEEPRVVRVIEPAAESVERTVERTVELDDETRAELERTIAFYRSPPEGTVCSTVDVVQISFRQGDRIVWTETHEDSTCETDFRGAPWSLAGLFDAERLAARRAGRDERMSRHSSDD